MGPPPAVEFYYTFGSPSVGNYSSTLSFAAAASRVGAAAQPPNALVFTSLPLAGGAAMPIGAERTGSVLRTTSLTTTTSTSRGLLASASGNYAQARAGSTLVTVNKNGVAQAPPTGFLSFR